MENNNVNTEMQHLPLIGDKAPEFTAMTTQGKINFPADFKGKWVILFSHPADFTPVCTTEFMTFASMDDEFQALNTQLVGLSVDALHSHLAWLNAIKGYKWKDLENIEVKFPLIVDISMEVSKKYGMIHSQSNTSAVRAVFIIDPEGIVRTILYYPASTGRNMEEIKRIIIALQKSDKDSVATPANWQPGDDVIVPAPGTCSGLKERVAMKDDEGINQVDWFLTFRKDNK